LLTGLNALFAWIGASITINRAFRAWPASKNIKHVDIETLGAHTWMVWRRNPAEFTSLLFR
jgi:hypothetical protein